MKEELLGMAMAAADAVLAVPIQDRGQDIAMGADGTPTTFVDKVAEDTILDFIDKNDVRANFLSEEAGFIDRGCEKILVVDPLDGTFNAFRGLPFYSVSVALGIERLADLEEAVVHNIASGDVFYAKKGGGAYLNGERLKVNEPVGNKEVLMAYMGSHAALETYKIASRFRRVRCMGVASLDICAVAAGQADAYYLNFQPADRSLRVMDIAAGVLILREAGGEAYDLVGNILDMPLSLKVRENIIAVGSKAMLELML